jgi:SAM-dependent methyltransferase
MVPHYQDMKQRVDAEKRAHTQRDILSESHKLKAKFPHVLVYPSRTRLFESIHQILRSIDGKIILDYGCGTGDNCIDYLSRGAFCHGIDICETYINAAQKAAQTGGYPQNRYSFQIMDAHRLGFKDETFDIVIGYGILHHLEPTIALDEIYRVLKPGGRLLLQEPLADNLLLRLFRLLTPHARTKDERPFTKNDINHFLSQHGWKSEISVCGLIEAPLSIVTSMVIPKRPNNALMTLADRLEAFTHRHKFLLSWNQYILLNFIKNIQV